MKLVSLATLKKIRNSRRGMRRVISVYILVKAETEQPYIFQITV